MHGRGGHVWQGGMHGRGHVWREAYVVGGTHDPPMNRMTDTCKNITFRVPTRTGKPGKMGRHFPVREKSGNFEQTGKVRENHTKYWKTEGISEKNYYIFFNDI